MVGLAAWSLQIPEGIDLALEGLLQVPAIGPRNGGHQASSRTSLGEEAKRGAPPHPRLGLCSATWLGSPPQASAAAAAVIINPAN